MFSPAPKPPPGPLSGGTEERTQASGGTFGDSRHVRGGPDRSCLVAASNRLGSAPRTPTVRAVAGDVRAARGRIRDRAVRYLRGRHVAGAPSPRRRWNDETP